MSEPFLTVSFIESEKPMKPLDHTTSLQEELTLPPISAWHQRLLHLHAQLRPHFARPEVHLHALQYLQAVLSDIPRKNGWQIAEQARHAHPYRMQRLLSRAVWDQDAVRDSLRSVVCQSLRAPTLPADPATTPFPVLVIDESGFPKRGRHSAGVAHQYCGILSQLANCQVGVFLSLVTELGHGLIDRELYLPQEWCTDQSRRQAAHIPDAVSFRTKPELGIDMLQRAADAQVPIGWVVGDTVYGHSPQLRDWLVEHGYPYALAVPCTEVVCVQTPKGVLLSDVASIAEQCLRPGEWQRLSASSGTKGERLFDWARLPVLQAGVWDGRHWLVMRRCLDAPNELAYYLVWAPLDTELPTMVQAIGARWSIEVDLQTDKALGLDHSEVRSYHGWYRHITLVLLAAAFLLSLCVQQPPLPAHPHADPPCEGALIALTLCEVRHLLARLLWPLPSSTPLVWGWSQWRRSHQFWAGYYHRRRRAKPP